MAFYILPMRPFVGLNILKLLSLIPDRVELLTLTAAECSSLHFTPF